MGIMLPILPIALDQQPTTNNQRLLPERPPVCLLGRVHVNGRVSRQIGGEDAESLHLADPGWVGAEARHVEPLDLVETLARPLDHGEDGFVVGVVGGREDGRS